MGGCDGVEVLDTSNVRGLEGLGTAMGERGLERSK